MEKKNKKKRKGILNSGLKALLAGAETSAAIKIPATFISELAGLPDDKQKVLAELSQEQFNQLLTQSELATINAADAAVSTKQNQALIRLLLEKVDRLSIDNIDKKEIKRNSQYDTWNNNRRQDKQLNGFSYFCSSSYKPHRPCSTY